METIVTAKGLRKQFGHQVAVDGIDFAVYRGECLGLLGPNGAGKTTTLRMLLGFTRPDAGSLTVLNYLLPEQARILRSKVGVVPQHDNLDPDFTVIENLLNYGRYFGFSRSTTEPRAHQLLEQANLSHKTHAKVTALSGGMKRRLVLARALINQPELLILDEPTTGLDPQARQVLWQHLHQLKKSGTTQILTTHFMQEAQRLCDRILVIDHGKILAEGKPNQLIQDFIEEFVFEIFGESDEHYSKQLKTIPGVRVEHVGDTLYCYSQNEKLIMEELLKRPHIKFIRRPGNLEDVFFKLTGRELREND